MSTNGAILSNLQGPRWPEHVKKPLSRQNRQGLKKKLSNEKKEGGAGAISAQEASLFDHSKQIYVIH